MRSVVAALAAAVGLMASVGSLAACGDRTTPATETLAPSAAPSTTSSPAPSFGGSVATPATSSATAPLTPVGSTVPTDRSSTAAATPVAPTEPPAASITIPVLPTPDDQGPVEGADISWPQCPKGMGIPQRPSEGAPMPLRSARFVVLGLTNGPAFYPNPCLADQVAWVQQRHLLAGAYSVISYPEKRHLDQYGDQGPFEPRSRLGRLANVGYQQAQFNVRTMQGARLDVPTVWLDVEPLTVFEWSEDVDANAAVVRGAARGYADQGFTVGVYSTQALWQRVVGDLRLGLPEWRAAGRTSRAEALRRCGPARMFQGGTAVLTQWVDGRRDRDVTCPGGSTYLSLWFRQL